MVAHSTADVVVPTRIAREAIWLLSLLFCLAPAFGQAAQLNTPRPDFWDADGPIHSIVATNGTIYLGGEFSYVAPKGSKALALDRYTAERNFDFPSIYGAAVHSIIEDGEGGWFIGGEFVQAGTTHITNLVHILSDNSIDPLFRPDPDGPVQTLLLEGGGLYFGGDFAHVGTATRSRLASWDLSLHQLTSWAPQANAAVSTLALDKGVLFAGGYFTQMSGQPRRNIAAVNISSGTVLDWRPDADGAVLSLAFSADRLYVGGFFNRIGGQLRNGLAALDPNSTNALPWDPNPIGGKVTTVRTVCSTVYVGGYFTNIAGQARYRTAAIDAQTAAATPWNPMLDATYSSNLKSYVLCLEVSANELFVGGQYNAQGHRDLAQFEAESGAALSWNGELDGGVQAIGISGRQIVVAVINSPGGVPRRNLAAFDEITGRVLDWNPDPDGPVYALTASSDRLFAGGDFLNLGSVPRTRLAAVNLATGLVDTNWAASANNPVYALAADSSAVFAGGSFTSISGLTRQRLCALNPTTGEPLLNWVSHADGTVYALHLDDDILYAGGNFASIAAISRDHVAALNRTSGQVQPWNPGANGAVRAIVSTLNTVYIGGSFSIAAGVPRSFVAAIEVQSGNASAWAPSPDDEVRALAVAGTNLFLGGSFQSISGQPRYGLAEVSDQGDLLSFNPSISLANRVGALAWLGSTLYAGGGVPVALQDQPSLASLAAFQTSGAPQIAGLVPFSEATPGQNVELVATVSGDPPLGLQWKFGSVDIPGATNSSLIVSNVQVNQSGVYELLVTNAAGALSAQSRLTVVQPPIIIAGPSAQTVSPGGTLTLAVLATANPPPVYQWRLNGANIPDAVFPSLNIANITAAQGGRYDVLVANRAGLAASVPAAIDVSATALPFSDNRATTATITSSSGTGAGSNIGATSERNEVLHAGTPGGHSVWLTWIPPSTGIASLSTRGSDFDTLLAVYTQAGPSNLTSVVSDDDGGGFSDSRVVFNVQAGTHYEIAVDGAYGVTGRIILTWDLDVNPTAIPVITRQPAGQSTEANETVSFSVAATSPTPLRYQWFFGCREIPNATNSTLVISNVQNRQVGNYHVLVMNNSTRVAQSAEAALEIGSRPDVVSRDKLEDLFLQFGSNSPSSFVKGTDGGPASAALAGSGGFLLVSMGSINSQILNNTGGSTQPGEPSHCGVLGGASKWLGLHTTDEGVLVIDTIGSGIDTVVAVYTGRSSVDLHEVACDDNGAPDHVRSLLRFNATENTDYLVAADGVNGAQGSIFLNWRLGQPPVVTSTATTNVINPGESLVLTVQVASATSPLSYQWRWNGTNVPGATNLSFTVPPGIGGTYSVVVSNPFGVWNQLIARVLATRPSLPSKPTLLNGQVRIWLPTDNNQTFSFEGSPDLIEWYWLEFVPSPDNTSPYRDYPLDDTLTFFRAVPWP